MLSAGWSTQITAQSYCPQPLVLAGPMAHGPQGMWVSLEGLEPHGCSWLRPCYFGAQYPSMRAAVLSL